MKETPARRTVRIAMELRVTYADEPGRLTEVLKTLRQAGEALQAHLVYRIEGRAVGLFVCKKPTEAALALQEQGVKTETETVVTVEIENRPEALSHLVTAIESEGVGIGYSYATPSGDRLCVVFRTDDNPRAEDALRNYLVLEDSGVPSVPSRRSD